MNAFRHTLGVLSTSLTLAAALAATPVSAQVFEVIYDDGANFGFNATRSVSPVPGNPATTLGGQRRAVMEAAADIWASRLDSAATIRINARFEDLGCGERTTLGLGGPTWLSRDGDLPKPDTIYPGTMVAAITGEAFDQVAADINNRFNSRLDDGDCIDDVSGFWYGLDPQVNPPAGTFSFLELALHEIGHGLGFINIVNDDYEFRLLGGRRSPDIMSRFIFDTARNQTWDQLTAAERATSAVAGASLTFSGERTNVRAAERLLPPGQIRVSAPVSNLRQFPAFFHGFPPFLPLEGISAPMRLPDSDNPGPTISTWDRNLACGPIQNPEIIQGNIALVYRGECTFSEKIQNVANAGAVGIIIVDNRQGGEDGAITRDRFMALDGRPSIPVYSVSRANGILLRGGLGGGRIYTLGYERVDPPGTNRGLVNLYSDADNEGSSVSHFSNRMVPQSLMNPSLTNVAFGGDTDFVPEFFLDLGWPGNTNKLSQYTGAWFNPGRDGEGCQLSNELGEDVPLLTCYLYRNGQQFWLIGPGEYLGDRFEFNEMIITSGTGYGQQFNSDDVLREVWGSITLRVRDCNTGTLDFSPTIDQGLPAFTTTVQKIVPIDCNLRASEQPDRSRTGSFFARDGEGVQITYEPATNQYVLTWYSYLAGEQVWMIGTGTRSNNRIVFDPVVVTSGGQWGLDFRPEQVTRTTFGRITVDYIDCNRFNINFQSVLPQFESFVQEMERIIPAACQ